MNRLTQRVAKLNSIPTPFYCYDLAVLDATLAELKSAAGDYHVHYALKANAHPEILKRISAEGFGADCVSGNEITRALECGFPSNCIAFAGVGKSDAEIITGLQTGIFSFNVESIPELKVIDSLAASLGLTAPIALRINPNVDAHTHRYITTGLEENKFGINPYEFQEVLDVLEECANLNLIGIHFHIGSQIQDLSPFRQLCTRANEINQWFLQRGHQIMHLNVGGGLGVDYHQPDLHAVPDFKSFFDVFRQFLAPATGQEIHFELGRSLVAQCGNLISRVLFVKKAISTEFAILDAGMTDLIRPALYQAYHKIENLSNPDGLQKKYDVVGPICESSDCFGKAVVMAETRRGDLIAIRTAGAYGQVMSSRYNLRNEAPSIFIQ